MPSLPVGHIKNRLVFSEDQESQLAEFIISDSEVYFGLSPVEVRKLAYMYAVHNIVSVCASCAEKEIAAEDSFSGFLKRYQSFSISTLEATSLAHVSERLNKHNVNLFFIDLEEVMEKHQFEPQSVWDMDETGITTFFKPNEVVARRVFNICWKGNHGYPPCAVSATGNSIPPFFIPLGPL